MSEVQLNQADVAEPATRLDADVVAVAGSDSGWFPPPDQPTGKSNEELLHEGLQKSRLGADGQEAGFPENSMREQLLDTAGLEAMRTGYPPLGEEMQQLVEDAQAGRISSVHQPVTVDVETDVPMPAPQLPPTLFETEPQHVTVETIPGGVSPRVSISQAMLEQDAALRRLMPEISGAIPVYGQEPILVRKSPEHGWSVYWNYGQEMAWVPLAGMPVNTIKMIALHAADPALYPNELRAVIFGLVHMPPRNLQQPPKLSKTQQKRLRRQQGR